MSINLDATIRYNRETNNLEHETVDNIFVVDWYYYKKYVYGGQPEFSSDFPITDLSLEKVTIAYRILEGLMKDRMVGSLKFKSFIEKVNEIGRLI